MYAIGDYIVYKQDGVCRIAAIGKPGGCAAGDRMYYTLKPLSYTGTIYAPVQADSAIRPVIGREAAEALVRRIVDIEAEAPRDKDKKKVVEHYERLMQPNDCEAYIRTIKSIWEKKHTETGAYKAISSTEEAYLKRAERCLYEELSVALDIPQDMAKPYIEQAVADAAGSGKPDE